MSTKRRQFSREFKIEAVRQVRSSGRPATAIAKELGISRDLLYRWMHDVNSASLAEAFPGHGHVPPDDEELRRLRRENARLREEREILKKAAAFFVKESR